MKQRQPYPFEELIKQSGLLPPVDPQIVEELKGKKKYANILFIRNLHLPMEQYEWYTSRYISQPMNFLAWYYAFCVYIALEDFKPDVIFCEGLTHDIESIPQNEDWHTMSELFPKNWRQLSVDVMRFSSWVSHIKNFKPEKLFMLTQQRDFNRKVTLKATCAPGAIDNTTQQLEELGVLPTIDNHEPPTFEPVKVPGDNLSRPMVEHEKNVVQHVVKYANKNNGKKIAIILGADHTVHQYFQRRNKPYLRSLFYRNIFNKYWAEGKKHMESLNSSETEGAQ